MPCVHSDFYIFANKLLASSERHGDLVSKISELEKTVKEQDAKLQEHSEENK